MDIYSHNTRATRIVYNRIMIGYTPEILRIVTNFLFITGFIIGLGAVTVIDLHGFFAQRSGYWTLATTRTHKITKPLIWIGTFLILFGEFYAYRTNTVSVYLNYISILIIPMILNGIFLSFYISPLMLKREKEKLDTQILPQRIQNMIFVSFIVSFLSWWSCVGLFVLHISN